MSKSLAQIEAQIAKLQKAAEAIKSKEVAAVVANIRALMKQHGLTVEHLGAAATKAGKAPRKTTKAAAPAKAAKAVKTASKATQPAAPAKASRKAAKPVKSAKPSKAAKPASTAKASKASSTIGVIKYRDDAGNAWTGRGKRPQWYLNALASGKTSEQLLVKSAG